MVALGWAALAAFPVIFLEVLYRRSDTWPWWAAFPAVLVTYLVYKTIHSGPSLLIAGAAFGLMTILARMGVSHFVLGEPVVKGNLAAAGFLIAAVFVGRIWR